MEQKLNITRISSNVIQSNLKLFLCPFFIFLLIPDLYFGDLQFLMKFLLRLQV